MKIDTELGLPARYTNWRDDQWRAVQAVTQSDRPCFLLDAPTGIGKSLLAIGSHRILDERCIYITRTKQLQDQIMKDFGDIAVSLKGKVNYPCEMEYDKFPEITAEDCKYEKPSYCKYFSGCQYWMAKSEAAESPLVVLNDAYFLNEANGFNGIFAMTDFLVVDEVDSIENGLMNFIQFTITAKQLDKYGLKLPDDPNNKEHWLSWMPGVIKDIGSWTGNLREQLGKIPPERWEMNEIEMNRSARKYERLADKLAFLKEEINYNWIFYSREVKGEREWVFKPVDIGRYADHYLWRHGGRQLGMSGTIFSPDIACRDLGISDCDYMRLECPFPIENRPIYYKPIVNLTRATMKAELPILTKEIDAIVARYPREKVLIHTVSYAVRDYLKEHLSCQERVICHESNTRESSLAEFKSSEDPLVMLSPSFDRGVDLPGEDNCRAVIVCKMPYLDMSDPQIKRKMDSPGGGTWYALKTTQTLVQMLGRAVRSSTQKCDGYILDRQFTRLRSQMKDVLPDWWLRAVKDLPVSSEPLSKTGMLI